MRRKTVSGIMLSLFLIGMLTLAFNIQPAKAECFVDAVGTYFETTNSTYLNITLASTETVHVILESVPRTVSFIIESNSSATSTILTFTGFQSNTTYYRYQDGYLMENFTTDSSGGYVYTQDISQSHHVSIKENISTMYITSDYTFTHDIYEEIVVAADNIVIDGNGYTLQGPGSGCGFYLYGRSNVTIKNTEIKAFYRGVRLDFSSNNTVSGNDLTRNNRHGILLYGSSNNTVSGNNITNNEGCGIWLGYSSNNNGVYENNITNNTYSGIQLGYYGYPKSNYNSIFGNNITNNEGCGVLLTPSDNNTVSGNSMTNNGNGIYLRYSSHNTISGNDITNNDWGIALASSSHNSISRNNITASYYGILFGRDPIYEKLPSHNIISGNSITNNTQGIQLMVSRLNTISGNTITDNGYGIWLEYSSNNSISANSITANHIGGIRLYESSNNVIYHNNFEEKIGQHASTYGGYGNLWDNGYPSGGNYWSDYTDVDVKSGPNQDQPSSDGIGDTAYVIDENNRDNYPLMNPWAWHTLTIHSSPTGVAFTVDGVSRTTPWSGTYSEGASVSLVMPETHGGYVWSHWLEDGDPNRIKTVAMDTNITLTGVYAAKAVGGKAVPIDKPIVKPELQIPWIWLSTIVLSLVATIVYIKKRKRNTRTLPYVKC